MAIAKLINLRDELEYALECVNIFNIIQAEFVITIKKFPNMDHNKLLNTLCANHEMSRDEFDLTRETHVQYYIDKNFINRKDKY